MTPDSQPAQSARVSKPRVTKAMVERGVGAIREVMDAAAPDTIRIDGPRKIAEIPFKEVTFEALARAVIKAALEEQSR